jgi:hypothetical protein
LILDLAAAENRAVNDSPFFRRRQSMSTVLSSRSRALRVVVAPRSRAEQQVRTTVARSLVPPRAITLEAIAGGFHPLPQLDLHDRAGRVIPDLVFTNFYVGGNASWKTTDIQSIDQALSAAMSDPHLNNVMVQYFRGAPVTSTFKPSRVLPGSHPARVSQKRVEKIISQLHASGDLDAFPAASTVFNLMLPRGTVLTLGGPADHEEHAQTGVPTDEEDSSLHGLGGFHGSIHTATNGIYYAVGVFSEGNNGIVAFDQPWKNVVATFYHELNEARTDADVEDAEHTGSDSFIGWTNDENPSEEIGDIPMALAGGNLSLVMKEVPLTHGGGKVPIQLMWSNAVHGPEGPIPHPRPVTH